MKQRRGPVWLTVATVVLPALATAFAQTNDSPTVPPRDNQAEAEAVPASQPVAYRRIFVQADPADVVPRDYVPIKRATLDELLASAEQADRAAQSPSVLTEAHYLAILEGDSLTGGLARLTVAPAVSEKSPDSLERLIPLEPWGLACQSGCWLNTNQPTVLGCDGTGTTFLRASPGGDALVHWSLRAEKHGFGGPEFFFQVPPAPISTFTLVLPPDIQLAADTKLERLSESSSLPEWVPASLRPVYQSALDCGLTARTFYWSGKSTVRFTALSGPRSAEGQVFLRQVRRVTLMVSRMELQEELHLDCLRPLDHLTLLVPNELTLLEARYGEQRLMWAVAPIAGGLDEYQLDFSPALQGTGHVVRLTFQADTVLHRLWRLPLTQVTNVRWTEGRMEMSIADAVEVKRVEHGQADLVRRTGLPLGVEQWEFYVYSPDAAWEMVLEPRAAKTTAEVATSLRIDRDTMTARIVGDLRSTWGDSYRLRCRVARPWVVEQVDLQPANALDTSSGSWRFEGGVLDIPLQEPLSPERAVRVIITARAPTPPRRTGLSGSSLRIIQFMDVTVLDSLYAVQAVPPLRAVLAQDAATVRVDPSTLNGVWSERLANLSDAILLRLNGPTLPTIQLAEDPPGFVAQTHVFVDVRSQSVKERYQVRCNPESSSVGHVRLRLAPRRSEPLTWSLEGLDVPLVSRLIPDPSGASEEADYWEVELPQLQTQPFVLHAQREFPLTDQVAIVLASVANAVSETGRVLVRSDIPLELDVHRMEQVPIPHQWKQPAAVLTALRYQAAQQAALIIRRKAGAFAAAWVVHSTVASRYLPTGVVTHQVDFLIRHEAATTITMDFPTTVSVDGVWINRQRAPATESTGRLEMALPADRQWSWVRVRYATQRGQLSIAARLEPPSFQMSVPVVSQTWMAMVPRNFHVVPTPWLRASLAKEESVWRSITGGMIRWRSRNGEPEEYANREQDTDAFLSWLSQIATSATSWPEFAFEYAQVRAKQANNGVAAAWDCRIDRSALRWLREQQWPGHLPASVAPVEKAKHLLQDSGLVALLFQRTVVFTTAAGRRKYGDICDEGSPVARVKGNSWLAAVLETQQAPSWGILPLETLAHGVLPPIDLPSPPGQDDAPELGWTHLVLEWPAERGRNVWIVRRDAVGALAVGAFLAAVCATVLLPQRRVWLLPLALTSAAALTLVLASAWIPFAQAAVAGILVGWIARAVRAKPFAKPATQSASSAALVSLAGAALLSLVATPLVAQESAPAASETTHRSFDVIIPINEQGTPSGEYAYVPRALHEHLRKITSRSQSASFLVVSAQHQIQGSSDAGITAREVLELVSKLRVWTSGDGQVVELPYQRSSGQLLQVWLDREPTDIRWNAEGDRAQIAVASAGEHLVELKWAFRWPPESSPWQVRIPPCPTTELIWEANELADWELVGTAGVMTTDHPGRGRVELPPTDRIAFRRKLSRQAHLPLVCRQLLWLRLRPGSVTMDAVWLVEPSSGMTPELLLAIDPRLRVLDSAVAQSTRPQDADERGNQTVVAVPLISNGAPVARVNASFLLSDVSGLGELAVPYVLPLNAKVQQLWLAVTGSDAVTVTAAALDRNVEKIGQFERMWGMSKEKPQFVVDLTDRAARAGTVDGWPSLTVRLARESVRVHQTTEISVSANVLDILWQGAFISSGTPALVRRINLPAGLDIQQVSLRKAGNEVPVRYAVGSQGILTVWSDIPLSGEYSLSIQGRISVTANAIAVPMFQVAEADTVGSALRVIRQTDVAAVQVEDMDDWQTEEVPLTESPSISTGRVVGVWRLAGNPATGRRPRLVITPNHLDATAFLATRLLRDPSQWWAEVEYHVRVSQGVMDLIRLELPTDWDTPLELIPAQPFQVQNLPRENRRLLLIRPPVPVTHQYQVFIRGPLAVSGDRVRRVPDVIALDVPRAQRFVLLPARLNTQILEWSTSGLQERPLPPFLQLAQQAGAWQSYAVVGPRFHASLHRVERVPDAPRIVLADINVSWRRGGGYSGVAMFDVESSSLESCYLVVPPTVQVIQVYLDGQPIVPRNGGGEPWQIPLGGVQLPQRVEVVFYGKPPPAGTAAALAVPYPKDIPCHLAIWTVRPPWTSDVQVRSAWKTMTVESRVCWQRLKALVDETEDGLEWAAEIGGTEAADWLDTWAPRVAYARGQLLRALAAEASGREAGNDGGHSIRNDLQELDVRWSQLYSRFGVEPADMANLAANAAWQESHVQWDASPQSAEKRLVFAAEGPLFEISVVDAARPTRLGHRALLAGLLLIGGLAITWASYRLSGRIRWPQPLHPLVGLLGVVALLWVEPPMIGVALLVVALWTAWWGPWSLRTAT